MTKTFIIYLCFSTRLYYTVSSCWKSQLWTNFEYTL